MIAKIKHTQIKRMKILLWRPACDLMEQEEIRVDVCVRGQHVYKDIWYAVVGEVLVCEKEPNNFQDLIFAHKATCENILTAKITQTTVYIIVCMYVCMYVWMYVCMYYHL